ncbi:MAG: hypothetical protein A2W01_09290 [Candidatus Solincola sediminis]|nr:MAG: hypothetical protein A2W01_09290 [Candidatus Solincola sediminis]
MPEYLHRFYREHMRAEGLTPFEITLGESDLFIWVESDLRQLAGSSLARHRRELEDFIRRNPIFETTYAPYQVGEDAPELVAMMASAAERVGVGPMAAVAGTIAQLVGLDLVPASREIIVENGGDIFIHSAHERTVGIFAGESPLSGKLRLRIPPTPAEGLGVCTSSATIGPSDSVGVADCALVMATTASLADAAATGLGNRAKSAAHIEEALAWTMHIEGVLGCLVIIGEHLGVRGSLHLA